MSVDVASGEPVDVNQETRRRARKDHICDACKGTISRTHFYIRHTVIFYGEVETIKRCLRCQVIYEALCKLHRELGEETAPAWRLDCGDTFEDVFGTEPPPELARLAFLTPEEMQRELTGVA